VLIVYWGILESAREGFATKTISWVPIVGKVIPDEAQTMRLRLKMAVIDVATGYWEILTPTVHEDKRASARIGRRENDQAQVNKLKAQTYQRAVEDLLTRYQ